MTSTPWLSAAPWTSHRKRFSLVRLYELVPSHLQEIILGSLVSDRVLIPRILGVSGGIRYTLTCTNTGNQKFLSKSQQAQGVKQPTLACYVTHETQADTHAGDLYRGCSADCIYNPHTAEYDPAYPCYAANAYNDRRSLASHLKSVMREQTTGDARYLSVTRLNHHGVKLFSRQAVFGESLLPSMLPYAAFQVLLGELWGCPATRYTAEWRNPHAQPFRRFYQASCQSLAAAKEAQSLGWSVFFSSPNPNDRQAFGRGIYHCPNQKNPEITCPICPVGCNGTRSVYAKFH